jgi:hypothetical protein
MTTEPLSPADAETIFKLAVEDYRAELQAIGDAFQKADDAISSLLPS